MIKCPKCRMATGGYYWPKTLDTWSDSELVMERLKGKPLVQWEDQPLYQRSYPGEEEYISPRCPRCFDKASKGKVR